MSNPWETNDDWRHVLCHLEPKNDLAKRVLAHNRRKPGRVAALSTEHGVSSEMLQNRLKEQPKQRRGLLMFGRYPNCSVECPTNQISLDHCHISLNPRSGVPMLFDTSRHHTTWLDGEQLIEPPYRAMVPQRAQRLRIHTASFQIHWPRVPRHNLSEHQSLLLRLAAKIQSDNDVFDLTDLELD